MGKVAFFLAVYTFSSFFATIAIASSRNSRSFMHTHPAIENVQSLQLICFFYFKTKLCQELKEGIRLLAVNWSFSHPVVNAYSCRLPAEESCKFRTILSAWSLYMSDQCWIWTKEEFCLVTPSFHCCCPSLVPPSAHGCAYQELRVNLLCKWNKENSARRGLLYGCSFPLVIKRCEFCACMYVTEKLQQQDSCPFRRFGVLKYTCLENTRYFFYN